jgi:hypothetical protein
MRVSMTEHACVGRAWININARISQSQTAPTHRGPARLVRDLLRNVDDNRSRSMHADINRTFHLQTSTIASTTTFSLHQPQHFGHKSTDEEPVCSILHSQRVRDPRWPPAECSPSPSPPTTSPSPVYELRGQGFGFCISVFRCPLSRLKSRVSLGVGGFGSRSWALLQPRENLCGERAGEHVVKHKRGKDE